jgi:hypothetical protein
MSPGVTSLCRWMCLRRCASACLDRNGVLIVTFTPIEGYSSTVKEYLTGAKTLSAPWTPHLLPHYNEQGRREDGVRL